MPTFYAACLASYNNGVLHGVHVEVSTDTVEMQDQINAMLRASKFPNVRVAADADDAERVAEIFGRMRTMTPDQCCGSAYRELFAQYMALTVPSAEEWQVHDWDDETGLFSALGETSDLKAIAKIAELAELAEDELGADWAEIVEAFCEDRGHLYVMKDDPSDIIESVRDAYQGTFKSREDWAADYAEQTGMLDSIPESLRYYFDFDAWARDAEINGDVSFVKGGDGVIVFNRD